MLQLDGRSTYGEDHAVFRDAVRKFLAREVTPNLDRWAGSGTMRRTRRNCSSAKCGCREAVDRGQRAGLGLARFRRGGGIYEGPQGVRADDFRSSEYAFHAGRLAAKLQVGWAHLDWAINRHVEGKLTAAEASAAKLWHTELQWEVVDAALQLHGGAGYMNEYPIARRWRDARVTRIFGGSNEIMKEVVGRAL